MLKRIHQFITTPQSSIVIIILILLFSFMRFAFINADAPQDLTISAAIYTDEGFKTYAARNMILFGDWLWTPADEYENWAQRSPIATWSYVLIFKVLGVNFAAIRILSILYSIGTMLLLYFFIKRFFDKPTSLIGLILFGVCFFNIMFNRLGLFETHVNFYIMLSLFMFTESFVNIKKRSLIIQFIPFLLGIIGLLAAFFVKRSFLIIIVSIAPAIGIHLLQSYNISPKRIRTVFIIFNVSFFILYGLLAHIQAFQNFISQILNIQVFGISLANLIPLKLFDPIYAVLGKGMYLEFIFLHPVLFTVAVFFSILIFYRYFFEDKKDMLNLYMACWLLYGFLFLTLMTYHPARYYIMLLIPLIILSSKAISSYNFDEIKNFITSKNPTIITIFLKPLMLMLIFYTGIFLFVQLLPFGIRSHLMRIVYPAIISNNITSVLHILLPILIFEFTVAGIIFFNRKYLLTKILIPKLNVLLFFTIILLQIFQYGKWFFFHENNLVNINRQINKELPKDSIITGSWSSGLAIENNARPLIIQDHGEYNYKLIEKLINNEEIDLNYLKDNELRSVTTKNIPLYFVLSKNVIFEKKIQKIYGQYCLPNNLFKKVSLGYFDLEIYRITKNR